MKTDGLTVAGQIAAVLIALAALVKCAQMPVHGWLIQVVEAPTPVSALLHAGIINLGGFLLILFAPLTSTGGACAGFVLVVAGLTTVLASPGHGYPNQRESATGLVHECPNGPHVGRVCIGLYELALLHLVAHACYKAHAFLNAGEEVLSMCSAVGYPQQYSARAFGWGGRTDDARCWIGACVAGARYGVVPWLLLGFSMTVLLVEGRHNDRFGNLARIVVGLPFCWAPM